MSIPCCPLRASPTSVNSCFGEELRVFCHDRLNTVLICFQDRLLLFLLLKAIDFIDLSLRKSPRRSLRRQRCITFNDAMVQAALPACVLLKVTSFRHHQGLPSFEGFGPCSSCPCCSNVLLVLPFCRFGLLTNPSTSLLVYPLPFSSFL